MSQDFIPKKVTQKLFLPNYITILLKLFVSGLIIFALLRFVLLIYVADDTVNFFKTLTYKSFLIGLNFDAVLLSYIFAFPIVMLFIHSCFKVKNRFFTIITTSYFCFVIPLMIFITLADIPYYKFFQNRISEVALQWMSNIGIIFQMITGNIENLVFLCIALAALSVFFYLTLRYLRKNIIHFDWTNDFTRFNKATHLTFIMLLIILVFLGMRGNRKRPIRLGDSFYCTNPILNQIGQNPVFTLLKSYASKVRLMDEALAIKNTQEILQIQSENSAISPIAREIKMDSTLKPYNIVIVIMEGMSAKFMKTFGNEMNVTPVLDSLSSNSMFFINAYSSGIHTHNGVLSILYSFPPLKRLGTMGTVPVRKFSGLPYSLKQNGYKNIFFCSHDATFDNLEVFIPANYFDELYSLKDFPPEENIGPFGVSDEFLFSYSIKRINQLDTGQRFFATILTSSNHDPYIIPSQYKSNFSNKELHAVSYADWAIGKFLNDVKSCSWYHNTIFVFVADHGRVVGNNLYNYPLSYNHIPLIIFSPVINESKICNQLIGQIDIFPTLMGMLNISYINNTLGVDAINNPRKYIYFSADDKIGCANDKWLYIYHYGGGEGLYDYRTGNLENLALQNKTIFDEMKKFALSQIQTAEWVISHNKTPIP